MRTFIIILFCLFFHYSYSNQENQVKRDSIIRKIENIDWKKDTNLQDIDSLSILSVIQLGITQKNYRYIAIGNYLLGKGVISNNKSIELLEKAEAAFDKIVSDKKTEPNMMALNKRIDMELLYRYFYVSNHEKSIKSAYKILSYAILPDDSNIIITSNYMIAMNYRNMDDYEKAVVFFNRTIDLSKENNNKRAIALSINEIANVHFFIGEIERSLDTHQKALEIANKIPDNSIKESILNDIGIIYMSHYQDYNKALEYFSQSKNLHKQETGIRDHIIIDLNIANCLFHLNQSNEALKLLQTNHELINKHNFNNEKLTVYELLMNIYKEKGDYKKAFDNQQIYISLKDSLFTHEKVREIAEIQSKYEASIREKEIQELILKQGIQKQREQKLWIMIAFVLLTFGLIFLGFWIRRKKEKQLYQKELAIREKKKVLAEMLLEKSRILEEKLLEESRYKSKQLTTHALNMLQKNKLLHELDNELKLIITKTEKPLKNSLNRIRQQLKMNMKSEKDWRVFKLYFEEVNKDFMNKIQDNFEDITTNDLRIAALTKLNLNIKEAASVLNIAPESLKKARYRLRKKMGLNTRENFYKFLNKVG